MWFEFLSLIEIFLGVRATFFVDLGPELSACQENILNDVAFKVISNVSIHSNACMLHVELLCNNP